MAKRITRNVSLTPRLDAFVSSLVASGEYESASEVVRDAVRTLQHARKARAAALRRLRADVRKGVRELDQGRGIPLDDVLQELRAPADAALPARRKSA